MRPIVAIMALALAVATAVRADPAPPPAAGQEADCRRVAPSVISCLPKPAPLQVRRNGARIFIDGESTPLAPAPRR